MSHAFLHEQNKLLIGEQDSIVSAVRQKPGLGRHLTSVGLKQQWCGFRRSSLGSVLILARKKELRRGVQQIVET
jgi:hypothetical protein